MKEVVNNSKIPIGFNFLLNDPCMSLTVAKASGAQFIRSDYFSDEMIRESDQLKMIVNPTQVINHRSEILADDIKIFADVQVKHAKLVKERSFLDSAHQTINDGAEGLIISGNWTGTAPDIEQLKILQRADIEFPIIIGSGFNSENAQNLLELSDGAIVGTAILTNGRVDREKAFRLMDSMTIT
jgi:uncharacterized protein